MSKPLRVSEVKNNNSNRRNNCYQIESGKISVKKRYGVYFRVSGSSQSLELQKSAAKKWAEANGVPWNEVEVFNEHALSANKVVMENRPELMRMLNAIKSGQINCVLVFTRCRFARNFYEYYEITDIFYTANTDVFFTCNETPPFSRDKLIEGIYGIQIQSEGANIKARLKDVQNMNPPQKFGYEKGENKRYSVDERYQYHISNAFDTISEVEGFDDLLSLILSYKKELNRKNVEDTWKIFRSPFYCGYYQKGNNFYQLEHVEPIIELDLFKRVQIALDQYEQRFIDSIIISREQSYITPICGICNKKMMHKNTMVGGSAYYKCSEHKSISVTTQETNHFLEYSIKRALTSISEEDLKYVCRRAIKKAMAAMRKTKKELNNELVKFRVNFVLTYAHNNSKEKRLRIEKLNNLISEVDSLNTQIVDLSNTQALVNELINVVKSGVVEEMNKDKLHLFISFLVKSVTVFNDSIELEVFLAEFVGGDEYE